MNDNMSNTPDNASRPGNAPHPSRRLRDKNGRFLPRKRNADTPIAEPGSVEEALAWPSWGEKDITVGQFLDKVHKFQEKDPFIGNVIRDIEEKEKRVTRIGQHIDAENKTVKNHTRRAKVKSKENKTPRVADNRRTMLYQIRTLPDNRGYGLYYADGVDLDEVDTKSKTVIVKHWLGENWYQAMNPGAAQVFATPDEARKFRREYFSVTVDDEGAKDRREARSNRQRTFREIGASLRHPSHTTHKKDRGDRRGTKTHK